ncbi:AraC family ligand binding domain-containing protein [Streptomyces rugosispiralis]|uniref:AraC family ligand binding domain-containing protein n=1 Tax=Streptomyces rugosispiralis TaxID=2967341 RepID=UPI0037045F9E
MRFVRPRYEQPGVRVGTTFFGFVRRQGTFDFAWHYHEEYELTLIAEGTGTRYVVGTTVERYCPGVLVLLGPDLPHTFASEAGEGAAEAVVVQFRHGFLGPEFFALLQFADVKGLLGRSARGVRFDRARDEIRADVAALPGLAGAAQTVAVRPKPACTSSETTKPPCARTAAPARWGLSADTGCRSTRTVINRRSRGSGARNRRSRGLDGPSGRPRLK